MKTDSKKDIVIAALKEMASESRYRDEGERFPSERNLAKRFGIGRNVLREAMITLESMGIIEKKERQGVFVKSQNTDGIAQNLQYMQIPPVEFMPMQMEVRMMLEVPAVQLAAVRRTAEDLEKLWKCHAEFAATPFSTPEEELANAKWEALLHHLETEAAHNPLLSRINESIAGIVERNNAFVHHHVLKDTGWFEHITEQHRTIIQAIEDGNSLLAGETLRTHLVEAYESIKKNYPQYLLGTKKIYWEAIPRSDRQGPCKKDAALHRGQSSLLRNRPK